MTAIDPPYRFNFRPANGGNRRVVVLAAHSGEGPFTKPTSTGFQAAKRSCNALHSARASSALLQWQMASPAYLSNRMCG
jgi:hypothetical protein